MTTTTNELIDAIYKIESLQECDVLFNALKERRKELHDRDAFKATATITVGDTVVLHGLSPKYLNGTLCKVTKVLPKTFQVSVIEGGAVDYRATNRLRNARVPASCVSKIEEQS